MTEESVRALCTKEGEALLEEMRGLTPQEFLLSHSKTVSSELRQGVAEQLLCAPYLGKVSAFKTAGALFEKDLLEQATPEPVSRYKATLLSGASCCELTGGMGSDTLFLSPKFSSYQFCEIDVSRALLFEHNANKHGLKNVEIYCGDSIEFLKKSDRVYDWIYADPARRSGGRKGRIALGDCEPNILENLALISSRALNIALKVSPAYDISQLCKELPWLENIYVISYKKEVRELFALGRPQIHRDTAAIYAVSVDDIGEPLYTFSSDMGGESVVVGALKRYLYEPEPALIKAGLVDVCAEAHQLTRVTRRGVFLTGDEVDSSFNGRCFRIVATMPWQRKDVARYLKSNDITSASVMRRDFPVAAAELKKQFKLAESECEALLFTTLDDSQRVMMHLERVTKE